MFELKNNLITFPKPQLALPAAPEATPTTPVVEVASIPPSKTGGETRMLSIMPPPPLWAPYSAQVVYGGLYVTVTAPCGCRIHFDTQEIGPGKGTLEVCDAADCDFQYDVAIRTGRTAIINYAEFMSEMQED